MIFPLWQKALVIAYKRNHVNGIFYPRDLIDAGFDPSSASRIRKLLCHEGLAKAVSEKGCRYMLTEMGLKVAENLFENEKIIESLK